MMPGARWVPRPPPIPEYTITALQENVPSYQQDAYQPDPNYNQGYDNSNNDGYNYYN